MAQTSMQTLVFRTAGVEKWSLMGGYRNRLVTSGAAQSGAGRNI
jgi:hypothetical protein